MRLENNEVDVEKGTGNPCEIRNRIKTKLRKTNTNPNTEWRKNESRMRKRQHIHSCLNQPQNPNSVSKILSVSLSTTRFF